MPWHTQPLKIFNFWLVQSKTSQLQCLYTETDVATAGPMIILKLTTFKQVKPQTEIEKSTLNLILYRNKHKSSAEHGMPFIYLKGDALFDTWNECVQVENCTVDALQSVYLFPKDRAFKYHPRIKALAEVTTSRIQTKLNKNKNKNTGVIVNEHLYRKALS